MPAVYDFLCPKCGNVQEGRCSISKADSYHPECEECGTPTNKTFIAKNFEGQLVLKGDWDSKIAKETKHRLARSAEMKKKQRDNHPVPKLAPNVDGERVESWSDAKKLAKDKGHDTRNYDAKVNALSKGNQ